MLLFTSPIEVRMLQQQVAIYDAKLASPEVIALITC
jgi:hypothetical protein